MVTGAAGFLGGAVMVQGARENLAISGWSRRQVPGLRTVTGYEELPAASDTVLVHLAQRRDASAPRDEAEVDLCRALARQPWRHIVYASSALVYGDSEIHARRPDEPVTAHSDYAGMKLECENIVRRAGGTCLRFVNLYGAGMGANTVIADILRQIPGQGALELRDVTPVREFIWIEDAARCITAACRAMAGGVLNAGTGIGLSIGDVARRALELSGESSRPVVGRGDSGRASCLVVDISLTRATLEWAPRTSLDTGLAALIREKRE
jgi:nucleoside-diphosphate-sugar epimerase